MGCPVYRRTAGPEGARHSGGYAEAMSMPGRRKVTDSDTMTVLGLNQEDLRSFGRKGRRKLRQHLAQLHDATVAALVSRWRRTQRGDGEGISMASIEKAIESFPMILEFLLTHPEEPFFDGWTKRNHYGNCGQSCLCCRGHNYEDAHWSGCEICVEGWTLTTVSSWMKFDQWVQFVGSRNKFG